MNGVLHSEHVISRSGIAVSPREMKARTFTLFALRSAGVAFLSTTSLWDESADFSNATPKSWRPDGFVGLSELQQFSLYKFFYVVLRILEDKVWQNRLHQPLRCGVL